jgi:hypothetical protein
MKIKVKETAKAWTIRYTRPKTLQYADNISRTFESNYCSVIVATSIAWAVEKLMSEFGDATIVSVNPGSAGPILIDERSIYPADFT